MNILNKSREDAKATRFLHKAVLKAGLKCLEYTDTIGHTPEERSKLVENMSKLLDDNAALEEVNCDLERNIGRVEGVVIGGAAVFAGLVLGVIVNAINGNK